MKAVVVEKYDAIDNIGLKDVALPEVSGGQVRVKIQATSIGFVDGLKVQGLYQTKDPLPFTPGTEFAGVVDEAAGDVTGFARGTPVMGMTRSGALAEYITVPTAAVTAIPDGIAPEVAAAFRTNYLTALYALGERASLRAGEQLLVLGAAGGTGFAAVQVGKHLGLRVIASASSPDKRAAALAGGADAVVETGAEDWRDQVKAANNGRPIDIVFDPVGGDATELAFRTLGYDGRHLVIGFTAGIAKLPTNLPLLKCASLVGVQMLGQSNNRPAEAEANRRRTLEIGATGVFVPAIAARFPIEEYVAAMHAAFDGKAAGRIVLTMG
jgi:NADPH2:quinone reductase